MKTRKKIICVTIFILSAAAFLLLAYKRFDEKIIIKQFFSMDTAVSLSSSKEYIDEYVNVVENLNEKLSAYQESSEICLLNFKGSIKASDDTVAVLNQAVNLTKKYPEVNVTAGALTKLWNVSSSSFEIPEKEDILKAKSTIKTKNLIIDKNNVTLRNDAQIDLGSCAKGYALDVLYNKLKDNKEDYAVVSFGSSSLLFGEKPDGKPFVTGIADPENKNAQALKFTSEQCFVSTSGGYERFFEADGEKYCHIIDLETGYPVQTDLTSVTVVSKESGLLTDFLSTCIFIGGTKNLSNYLDSDEYEVIALDKNKNIYCSDSISESITILDDQYKMYD